MRLLAAGSRRCQQGTEAYPVKDHINRRDQSPDWDPPGLHLAIEMRKMAQMVVDYGIID
jgi:hypothetical protein